MIAAARNEWRQEATGVTVRVFYIDREGVGVPRELAPQQVLSAPNAATIEALLSRAVATPSGLDAVNDDVSS